MWHNLKEQLRQTSPTVDRMHPSLQAAHRTKFERQAVIHRTKTLIQTTSRKARGRVSSQPRAVRNAPRHHRRGRYCAAVQHQPMMPQLCVLSAPPTVAIKPCGTRYRPDASMLPPVCVQLALGKIRVGYECCAINAQEDRSGIDRDHFQSMKRARVDAQSGSMEALKGKRRKLRLAPNALRLERKRTQTRRTVPGKRAQGGSGRRLLG